MRSYDEFWSHVQMIEKNIREDSGIKDVEFIKDQMFGGEWIGIGNVSRTMALLQREDLE